MTERDRSETIRSLSAAELSIMAELYAESSVRLKAADGEESGSASMSPDTSSSDSPLVSGSSSIGFSEEEGSDESFEDAGESWGSGGPEEEHESIDHSGAEESDQSLT